ncbi:hypothetical protein SBV1_850015 [Verrucomicrobia bacterium]|nr:hypothetical protein SBV1_850015 [Verrucomicrobiota bacterium]
MQTGFGENFVWHPWAGCDSIFELPGGLRRATTSGYYLSTLRVGTRAPAEAVLLIELAFVLRRDLIGTASIK